MLTHLQKGKYCEKFNRPVELTIAPLIQYQVSNGIALLNYPQSIA
jgi:hypothetical protein